MKKLFGFILVLFILSVPQKTFAFAEDPVAVLVMGDYGSINSNMANEWTERVKRRFRFPDYKILAQDDVMKKIKGNLPAVEGKAPYFRKEQLAKIAQMTPAEVVFVIWVHNIYEEILPSWRLMGDTLCRVTVYMDITAYRKTDDKYIQQKVRYSEVRNVANSDPARKVAADKVSEAVDKAREQMPRLKKEAKNAE